MASSSQAPPAPRRTRCRQEGRCWHPTSKRSFDRITLQLDGQERADLSPRDEVRVRLDRARVRLFQNPARPFGVTLRRKLGWQGSANRSF